MKGTMMQTPLTLPHIVERVGRYFADQPVVSRMGDGKIHRYTYGECYARTLRLASALGKLGVGRGERVATLAWNHYRHLEAYLAIPAMGGVLHTVNLRLFPEQIVYIFNHAEDRVLLVDASLLPLWEKVRSECRTVEQVIVMADTPGRWSGRKRGYSDYERFLDSGSKSFDYPDLREDEAAGMCYTSGTTGEPKGVVYTHRSTCLHSMVTACADGVGVGMRETILPVVPMFHANAWGLPYACAMTGAKQVYPGPDLSAPALLELITKERVTIGAGVPTIWGQVLEVLAAQPKRSKMYDLSTLHTLLSGGSAVPRHQIETFQERYGVHIRHAWGMTEMSPMGTMAHLKPTLPEKGKGHYDYRCKQGIPVPFVEVRAVDGDGAEVPSDGEAMGDLQVRGPWIASGYYKNPKATRAARTKDGWFRTGDVVTVDEHGFIKITDRTKDLIKSGGEWISSVDMENLLMSHPDVLEASVIAIPDPKWDERPLAFVVLRPGRKADEKALNKHLSEHFAKWQLPDHYRFVDEIPKTSVGKFDKKVLRARYAEDS